MAKTASPWGDTGRLVTPKLSFAESPAFDLIVVPGAPGPNNLMADDKLLRFLRAQAKTALWVTSVCTGSLLLAAAGLLDGCKATCDWQSLDFLRLFPVKWCPSAL